MAPSSGVSPSAKAVSYMIDHVVLPPKLPQADDRKVEHEKGIFELAILALQDLQSAVNAEHTETVMSAITTIENLRNCRDHHGDVSEAQLEGFLTKLTMGETDGALPLEIKAQNAGILLSRCSDSLNFEFFELTPTNEAAMKLGRLVRIFPGYAARIPIPKMTSELRKSLAGTISKMTTQTAPGFQPQVLKNRKMLAENRDTTHPGLVTDFLMNIIAAVGESTDVRRISKNTREEALWMDCFQPWQRSPLWLLLRVTLQLHFTRVSGNLQPPDTLYKSFMILFLSKLLDLAKPCSSNLGSESLHAITAKLIRRLRKFDLSTQIECIQPIWTMAVRSSILDAHQIMNDHWQGLLKDTRANIDTSALSLLCPMSDLNMELPGLDVFITGIASRKNGIVSDSFQAGFPYPDCSPAELPDCTIGSGEYKFFSLMALEKWVEKHLRSWLDLHLQNENTCGRLRHFIESYHSRAHTIYAGMPNHMSVMYLTLAELWIACDLSACNISPLLREYDPEICASELECLVLPLKSQMQRLHVVEDYLTSRRNAAAIKKQPSVYSQFGHASSFAVRYFEQSNVLQTRLSQIERDATRKRQQKCEELAQLKKQYKQLMDQYNNTACETRVVVTNHYHGYTEEQHHSCCSRCAVKRRADGLKIRIYEWPLSSHPAIAKATVFELEIPQSFSDWRDVSHYMITTIFSHQDTRVQRLDYCATLETHRDLSHMLSPRYSKQRIVLASSIKAHSATHRKSQKDIPHLREDDVCLENALRYSYYDRIQGILSTDSLSCTERVVKDCMYRVPPRSKDLERFMCKSSTTPNGLPPNEVIASLSDCPTHFSVEEFKALASIPLGHHILYSNILTQLANSAVDFTKVEVQCFMVQIIQQAGQPNNHVGRTSHHILKRARIGEAILDQLGESLQRLAENWESWRALATFSLLARRILSLTASLEMKTRCIEYLEKLRSVCMVWINRLKQRAGSSTEDEQRSEMYSRATEIALLCTSTYDVEDAHFDKVLRDQSTISALLQCSVTVQENFSSVRSEFQDLYKAMLQSWRALMYRIFPTLRQRVLLDNVGLCEAVTANWIAFQPAAGATWISLSKPQQHWLHINSGLLPVHFNLLTAELLVNGLPLARLPSEYMQHPMYAPLFEKSTMEVVPTDEPGLEFSAKVPYHGYKLHFGMDGQHMLVVAIGDKSRFDLLPSTLLQHRLPQAFFTDHVHWYDNFKDEVIFRSRKTPWVSGVKDWRLIHDHTTRSWRLVQESNTLVNITSPSAHAFSKILRPLENPMHIHVVLNSDTQVIDIDLPRLQLVFYAKQNSTNILSRQYRGMLIDDDQTIGALVGLSSKLTLKGEQPGHERMVLIPVPQKFGGQSIQYQKSNLDHVNVTINKDDATRVYAYSLDKDLKRVLSSGDVQSQLFLCYLFALTSHCLPDLMTMRTGTESALAILQSAAVRSFDVITQNNVDLLAQIRGLSPTRSFYPPHEKVMQQIAWNANLPSLSQHPGFREGVESILEQAAKMQPFYPEASIFSSIRETQSKLSSDRHLILRDAIRASTFRTSGFGADRFTISHDVKYQSRDRQAKSERGLKAFEAATMMLRDRAALHSPVSNLKAGLLRTHFNNTKVTGLKSSFEISELRYDSKWLETLSEHLTEMWCTLHQNLVNPPSEGNKFDIMVWIATLAYAKSTDMDAIQALVGFYRLRDFRAIKLPSADKFILPDGDTWNRSKIQSIVQHTAKSYESSAEARLPKEGRETEYQHLNRIKHLFETRQTKAIDDFLSALEAQWPVREPNIPTLATTYLDPSSVILVIKDKFKTWWDNRRFLEYLVKISTAVRDQTAIRILPPRQTFTLPTEKLLLSDHVRHFGSRNIFPVSSKPSLSSFIAPREPEITAAQHSLPSKQSKVKDQLELFCGSLETYTASKCEKEFVANLRTSCVALDKQVSDIETNSLFASDTQDRLKKYQDDCENYFDGINKVLVQCVAENVSRADQIGLCIQQSPRLSPSFWLEKLHRDQFEVLPEPWRAVVVEYGMAITQLHRAQRLLALSNKPVDLAEELGHTGHSNWNAREQPETLLLEAENGIMVRKEQALIAGHMISPQNRNNAVVQLQMGQGKSTVLTPLVAAALTDKKRLVRVIVAKPQSRQMLQMLISKLGGLLNRRIYHMPFSRTLKVTENDAKIIQELYEECMANRGVLLIQPEHILSFKLMGIEMLLTNQHATARLLLSTQKYFDEVSRDIVDESDENYNVKFELIYTMGAQQAIEFAPERWLIIQEILGLVPRFALEVKQKHPRFVDIQDKVDGKFPRVRILDTRAAEQLLDLLAKHIVERGVQGLPCRSQSPKMQMAILRYITEPDLEKEDIESVEGSKFWTDLTELPLLLVRGLIAGGILRFALSTKRWRVNFGLDANRVPSTSLAVPYRFKDSPSPRSEFSHPDVVILLTMMSFYYQGLSDEQLFDAFMHLAKSDQSAINYHEWVSTAASSLPAAFRQLSGVSIRDRHQCIVEVFPALRYSRKAIDYYLSYLVFPKQLKQFLEKLSASGWDIGAVKTHPTTGFSGTNDTLHLLPLDVKHLDLPSQKYTNAQVLSYLLRDETSILLLCSRTSNSKHSDAEHLISFTESQKSDIRVIIDCGASILEQNNKQVAETWLRMRTEDVQAVVFFDEDELSVLDRSGRVESFQTSSFAKQLDLCVVYLDQPHARGTDLRLPRDYRAAVTLGSQLTKDHLAQACMRMRKLGHGQAVTFIIPEEISTKIYQFTKKSSGTPIEVLDVLCWSIGETWQELKRNMPLWAVQGERYERHRNLLNGSETTMEQAKQFLEKEAQSLDRRYRPQVEKDTAGAIFNKWDTSNDNIAQIISRCHDFEALGFGSAALSEEQERELAPEIEEERQIERPLRMVAEKHKLHTDLWQLICSGELMPDSKAFEPAFQALRSTSAAKYFNLTRSPNFPSDLFVTIDFMRTVVAPTGSSRVSFVSDSYQRPVQFVLSVPAKVRSDPITNLIIISPFEANGLLPKLRETKKVTLHLFSPRSNAIFPSLDELMLYNVGHPFSPASVSRSLTMQLNLFAGTLYLRSFQEYGELCKFLGLLQTKAVDGQQVYADGFIDPPAGKWGLKKSPVPFLRALLMKIRREGEGVEKTHMGKILSGVRLEEEDFQG